MISKLQNEDLAVTIPGFYDRVENLSEKERSDMGKAPFSKEDYCRSINIENVHGEKGYTTMERGSIRPSLDVNGIWGGYTGEGAKTVIPSKAQLVTPSTFIYKPGRGGAPPQILGVKEVCEKFQVTSPTRVIDILGLWGDASDNIPGIPGIGEKTSKLLISKYGSMEGIFENVEDLKGKQKEKHT